MSIILIGGGSRSGKSSYALHMARQRGERRGFLATAQAGDEEMRARIEQHRATRGTDFVTIEEPCDITNVIHAQRERLDVLVIDCLTLWLSNILTFEGEPQFVELVDTAAQSRLICIFVTNEVGCGIIPDNELARRFRDLAGSLNQQFARRAEEVYWMVFGQPLRIK